VALANLPDEWQKIPRRRKPNERYAAQCRSTLARFAVFVRAQNPKAEEISHVTRDTARAFMAAEEARGVTAKTWNDTLKLLRASYKYLLPAGSINPFSSVPTRETETIFRKPFTPEELKAIVDAAREDDFIRPILITGMCTAMRRGDCCLLKWKDVDLARRFITVKTNKTGVTVSIPIFPMLYDELALRQPSEAYVFPEQAKMYVENLGRHHLAGSQNPRRSRLQGLQTKTARPARLTMPRSFVAKSTPNGKAASAGRVHPRLPQSSA
jgi:integrase